MLESYSSGQQTTEGGKKNIHTRPFSFKQYWTQHGVNCMIKCVCAT